MGRSSAYVVMVISQFEILILYPHAAIHVQASVRVVQERKQKDWAKCVVLYNASTNMNGLCIGEVCTLERCGGI